MASHSVEHPRRNTDNLLKKMWQTKSSHFNAQVRLMRKHRLSIAATSVLAFYLFAVSAVQLGFENSISPFGLKAMTVATLIMSVFLLMIVLLEGGMNYAGDAERMHRSALKISELYNEFQAMSVADAETNRGAMAQRYSELLERFEKNHKDLDYNLFRIPNARELAIPWGMYCAMLARTALLGIAEYWFYFVLVLLPPIAFFLLLPRIMA